MILLDKNNLKPVRFQVITKISGLVGRSVMNQSVADVWYLVCDNIMNPVNDIIKDQAKVLINNQTYVFIK